VFLDRDGVLNAPVMQEGRSHPPASLAEMRLLAGTKEACAALRQAGFLLICVTNQPDIARGATSRETVDVINAAVGHSLELDDIFTCPHDDADRCDCRKPLPGLLIAAAQRHGIDLSRSFMVGDRWRDIEAGRAAGCRTVLVDWNYDEPQAVDPDLVVTALADAVTWIVASSSTPLQTCDGNGEQDSR
jgi:D-glycero-D-manno-heptose 1,7-bisphosphate phosphatase